MSPPECLAAFGSPEGTTYSKNPKKKTLARAQKPLKKKPSRSWQKSKTLKKKPCPLKKKLLASGPVSSPDGEVFPLGFRALGWAWAWPRLIYTNGAAPDHQNTIRFIDETHMAFRRVANPYKTCRLLRLSGPFWQNGSKKYQESIRFIRKS